MASRRILTDQVLLYPLTRPRLFAHSCSHISGRRAVISVATSKFLPTSKLQINNLGHNTLRFPGRRPLYIPSYLRPAFQSHLPPSAPPSFWQSRPYSLPWSVALICGSCFVYSFWPREDEEKRIAMKLMRQNFTSSLTNFREGRWWTLLTPTFMHGSLLHLMANMAGLLSFGPEVVKMFGPGAFVITWVGAGIFASATSLIRAELKEKKPATKGKGVLAFLTRNNKASGRGGGERGSAGASGSIFGLVALFTCFAPRAKLNVILTPVAAPAWQMMLGIVGFSVAAMEFGWLPGYDHAGHLGGMAFGLLYYAGWALRRRRGIPRFR